MGPTFFIIAFLWIVSFGFPALGTGATYLGDSACQGCHQSFTDLDHFEDTAHQNSIRDILNTGSPSYRNPSDPKWGVKGNFKPEGGFITRALHRTSPLFIKGSEGIVQQNQGFAASLTFR